MCALNAKGLYEYASEMIKALMETEALAKLKKEEAASLFVLFSALEYSQV